MGPFKIFVLCPSGHTVTLEVTSNDAAIEILDKVCQKRNLDPNRHRLRHQKANVDPTTPIRYTNIQNKSKLELVEKTAEEIEKCENRNCIIFIQERNKEGAQLEFLPETKLIDVVKKLESLEKVSLTRSNESEEPLVRYMTKEVVGYDRLSETSLRSLGIMGGSKERLWLDFRTPGAKVEQRMQYSVSSIKKPKRAESPPRRAMRVEDGRTGLQVLRDKNGVDDEVADNNVDFKDEGELNYDVSSNSSLSSQGTAIKKESEDQPEISPENVGSNDEIIIPQVNQEESPEKVGSGNEVIPQVSQKESPEILFLDEKESILIFLFGDGTRLQPQVEEDDIMFEHTTADVLARQRQLREEARLANEGEPLQFKSQRQSQRESTLLNTYDKAVLRVQFPDRKVLQLTFPAANSVQDLKNVIKQYLIDPEVDFYLFRSPPRTVLEDEKATMAKIDCVPNGTISFGCKNVEHKTFLKPELPLSNSAGAFQVMTEAKLLKTNN